MLSSESVAAGPGSDDPLPVRWAKDMSLNFPTCKLDNLLPKDYIVCREWGAGSNRTFPQESQSSRLLWVENSVNTRQGTE